MRRLLVPAWLVALLLIAAWLRHLRTGGDATFAAARSLALVAACYLLSATAINLVLALTRVRFRLPLVPMIVAAALTAPMIGTPAFAAAPLPAASAPPPVMHRLPDPPSPAAPAPAPAPVAPAPAQPSTTANLSAPARTAVATWTVRHGQCFWTIASNVMRTRLGRAPTNAEIAAYWRRLIEANRARLVRPADPGLLFAGQELVLPSA